MKRLINKLPALPRFSDEAQRKAGGNIIKFMAGLLVLTLVARGTSGASLARVDLSRPVRGEIVEAVTGSATVSVRDTVDIFAPEGLTVTEMLVGTGQSISKGDPVAIFSAEEIEEKLSRERAALEKLLLDLERLERTDDTDSGSVESARRSLTRARDDYNDVRAQGAADVAAALGALNEALSALADDPDAAALDTALRNLRRAQEDYDAVLAQGEAETAAAQAALDEALRAQAESVDLYAVDTARRTLTRAREDYSAAIAQGDADVSAAWSALTASRNNENAMLSAWENAAQEDKAAAWQAYLAAQTETARAQDALDTAQRRADESILSAARRVEDAENALAQAEQNYNRSVRQGSDAIETDIDRARDAHSAAVKRAEDNLLSAARRVEDAEIALDGAERNYDRGLQQGSDAVQADIERARNAYSAAVVKAEDNLRSAARRVEDAEIALDSAERSYDRSLRQAADNEVQNNVNAITLRLDINDLISVVDALDMLAADDGVLYSSVTGVVSSALAGGSVTGRYALVAFTDGANGYEANMAIDKTQAGRLSVGDECRVTTGGGSMYYNPTVTGTISSITSPDEHGGVLVTIRLPEGDWTGGQRVDVQAVQDRNSFDMCVPLSALRSDNSGYYLLAAEQKSTILGVENVVIRVPVSVIASDDDLAAVQGSVNRNSLVITGSNKAVAVGDRVRMNDQE